MSITDDKRPDLDRNSDSDTGSEQRSTLKAVLLRPVVLVSVAAIAAAAIIGAALWGMQDGSGAAKIPRTSPITLPDTIGGLRAAPRNTDFGAQQTWLDRAHTAASGATVAGRAYGSAKLGRQIRVVAGRADLKGKLEFAWAADSGRQVTSPLGAAQCTQNFKLTPQGTAAVRSTMLLCWRTTSALSAYSLIIDFKHDPSDADGVAVLDSTWKAAETGR